MTRIIIIGGGIIGCAIAKELSRNKTFDIHVLEKNNGIGQEITSRNSGVIHAGLYYPPSSLKSQLCQEGRDLLYEWCQKKDIPHRNTGKLIVATNENEESQLSALYKNACDSGVARTTLLPLSKNEIFKISPYIKGYSALHSIQTGIVDAHALCNSFYVEALHQSAEFHFNCEVKDISFKDHYTIQTSRGEIEGDMIINAAGLYADEIAKCVGINPYTLYPYRGDYFKIRLPYAIHTLVYPVRKKDSPGIGVHLTLDMKSNYFLGPDVEMSVSKNDFSAKPEKRKIFFESADRLFKDITLNMLTYETCGIRPKLRAFDETKEKDFVISQDLPGFFNLIGIESPGLTASLAIARFVRDKII